MKKIIATALLVMGAVMAMPSISATYKIADTFDGCERGKFYPLTKSGKYLRCDQYTYFYKYRPDVIAEGNRVYAIDGREVRGTIVDGYSISTNISDEWEGCDWDSHRLDNGMVLQCSSYFYEYAYRPSVEIIVIEGRVVQVLVNGEARDGIQVYQNQR
tara:strand:+ start:403 stop:876 length:474 start_codon:yes stop_codon:yes gene_type:complete